jgi:hypothetical protein
MNELLAEHPEIKEEAAVESVWELRDRSEDQGPAVVYWNPLKNRTMESTAGGSLRIQEWNEGPRRETAG